MRSFRIFGIAVEDQVTEGDCVTSRCVVGSVRDPGDLEVDRELRGRRVAGTELELLGHRVDLVAKLLQQCFVGE